MFLFYFASSSSSPHGANQPCFHSPSTSVVLISHGCRQVTVCHVLIILFHQYATLTTWRSGEGVGKEGGSWHRCCGQSFWWRSLWFSNKNRTQEGRRHLQRCCSAPRHSLVKPNQGKPRRTHLLLMVSLLICLEFTKLYFDVCMLCP